MEPKNKSSAAKVNHRSKCHTAPGRSQYRVYKSLSQRKIFSRYPTHDKPKPKNKKWTLVEKVEIFCYESSDDDDDCVFKKELVNDDEEDEEFGSDHREMAQNGCGGNDEGSEDKFTGCCSPVNSLAVEGIKDDVDTIYLRPASSTWKSVPIINGDQTHAGITSPKINNVNRCWEDRSNTISRASSRKSGSASATTSVSKPVPGSDNESDVELSSREVTSDLDFKKADIFDDKAWDTDLESEESTPSYVHSRMAAYKDACKLCGVVPVSYFLRHMQESKVNLSHHGLGAKGMKAISMSLMTNTEITDLNLSDNWLGYEGGYAVCEMLKENCFITHLDLSDNKLDFKCAETIAGTLLQNDSLKHVILTGNEFDDKSAEHFARAIMETKTLEILNLSKNNFGEHAGVLFGPAISENSCIKELDLSWNHIRRRGAVSVAYGVKTNVFMKKINLSWNGFGVEGAMAIGDALKGNSVLEEIDISNNRINTEGAVIIGKGLAVNETLKVLMIGKNPLQSAGCWAICAALLKNPSCILEKIDFADILVNQDFNEIFSKVQEQLPELKMRHGGMEPPLNPKVRVHPMVKLHSYIQKNNLRLVDFFNKFDKDKSMSVTREEFLEGLVRIKRETGINLTEDETQQLLDELDMDGDGEINYSELVIGHTDFQEKERQMNMVITTMRPVTT